MKYIQQDWQGSVRTVTNGSGSVLSRTDYQAFGEEIASGVGGKNSTAGLLKVTVQIDVMTKMPKLKNVLVAVLACLLLIFTVSWAVNILPFFFPKKGDIVLEKWQVDTGRRRLEVTAFAEKNAIVWGAYYVFESVDDAGGRTKIMTFRSDDPVPINRSGIRVVNAEVTYIFMGWMYAATQDGGVSWSVWNAEDAIPNWTCCNYEFIKTVDLQADGKGKMTITQKASSAQPGNEEQSYLYTTDFGRSWTPNP